jgi:hypothetical protein
MAGHCSLGSSYLIGSISTGLVIWFEWSMPLSSPQHTPKVYFVVVAYNSRPLIQTRDTHRGLASRPSRCAGHTGPRGEWLCVRVRRVLWSVALWGQQMLRCLWLSSIGWYLFTTTRQRGTRLPLKDTYQNTLEREGHTHTHMLTCTHTNPHVNLHSPTQTHTHTDT